MNMLKDKVWVVALLLLSAYCTAVAEHVTYFHNDGLGSPVAATNDQGEVLWTEAYDPYGNRLVKPEDPNRLWYTGKPEESKLGLTYFGARWYEPGSGRFHGVDPKEVEPGDIYSFNRYAYGNGNPYKYVDPDGRFSILAVLLTTASVGILMTHSDYAWAPGLNDSPASLPASAHALAIAEAAFPVTVARRLALAPAAAGAVGSEAGGATVKGVDALVDAAKGKARSSGDIVVDGGRQRAKELFREFDTKGVGNRTIVQDKTGGGRGVEGALGDGTPLRIRMKPDGTTRIQAGDQKFIFPPN